VDIQGRCLVLRQQLLVRGEPCLADRRCGGPYRRRLREASAFTKLKPTTELQIVSRPDEDQTGQPNDTREAAPPIKTVEKAPADPGATECKKYFPSVGETLRMGEQPTLSYLQQRAWRT
jgi:hypothetical protein